MKKLILIPILTVIFSCTKPNNAYCYVISSIEVNGEIIEIDTFKCGCFPNSKPQGETEFEYEGKIYPITKKIVCY